MWCIIKMISLISILDVLYGTGKCIVSAGIAVLPVIGFIFQYLLIRRRQSIGSFSIQVCGILLLSNIFKIGFFIYKTFAYALLAQALIMITVQVVISIASISCWNFVLKWCMFKAFLNVHNKIRKIKAKNQTNSKSPSGFGKTSKLIVSLWITQDFIILGVTFLTFSFAFVTAKLELSIFGELLGYVGMGAEVSKVVYRLFYSCLSWWKIWSKVESKEWVIPSSFWTLSKIYFSCLLSWCTYLFLNV